ncbi:MAG TPA: hypothetical protein PK156_35740 [Polyangium sp.]|nr:hypothetical protein [Polyangium sp.]
MKSSKKGAEKLLSWDVLVEAHIEKTKTVYGLPPLPPDLKHADRKALAALLDGAAAEVHAQLHERTGLTHDIAEVRSDLAKRVMHLYFKNDNPHLRRVKHALRDLPREFHARLIEARQALLRESHDAAPPRRVQLEQPIVHVDSVDKPVEETKQEQLEQPKESSTSTHKPASMEGVASADKPVNVAPSKTSEPASPPPPNPPSTSVNTAREARKLLEALSVPSPQQELFKRPSAEVPKPTPLKRPVLPEWMQAELEQARASADKPAPARKSFEQKPLEDKPSSAPPRGQQVERPLGRSGAPRWGAVGPRPAKVRRAPKLAPDDVESGARHGDSSATKP